MLAGLSPLEIGRLRLSVGYGTHKKGRPLSPMEVALLLRQARDLGASLNDCAKAVKLGGTQIARFFRILDLPQDLRHLVDWGKSKDAISFSSAVELARVPDASDQRAVARSLLADGLDSKEVRQVAQLRKRSWRAIDECVREVLGMRQTIEKRYVFIGSIVDGNVENLLDRLTQRERDSILMSGIEMFELHGASGRLGKRFFTLVGDERFDASMKDVGKGNIETRLRRHIGETVGNAGTRC